MSVTKIIDRIWLGDKQAAKSKTFLETNDIDIIINCSRTIKNYYESDYEYYRVEVNDRLKPEDVVDMSTQIHNVVAFIYEKYKDGKNILIHCRKGKQRSATVVCSFLTLIYPEKEMYDIMSLVTQKRPEVFDYGKSVNFVDILMAF